MFKIILSTMILSSATTAALMFTPRREATHHEAHVSLGWDLNNAACDLVNKEMSDAYGGCYDLCVMLSDGFYVSEGKQWVNWDESPVGETLESRTFMPVRLAEGLTPELQNACAVVLMGPEF